MRTLFLRVLIVSALLLGRGWGAELSMEYRQALQRANEAFAARDWRRTLDQCDQLDKLQPNTPVTLNLRGAVALEERRFEEGLAFCQRAIELDPKFFPARFNLAEAPFMQRKYSEARGIYEQLLAEDPKNELLQYRIFLTYLLEGNEAAAEDALKRVRFPGDTAAYYFAHAAWEFAHRQTAAAESWINSGDWVFSKEKNQNFADVFYDLGWLKRGQSAPAPSFTLGEKPPG